MMRHIFFSRTASEELTVQKVAFFYPFIHHSLP